jgi:uncharacterized protein YbaP (TraB family)
VISRLLALAGALCLAACGEPAREWPEPSPALWEVTGAEGQQGWLFGTVHALPGDLEWRTAQVDAAFDAADLLVVEIAELGDSEASAAAFAARARGTGLPPLLQRVNQADRAAVAALLDKAGREEDEFAGVETWAAALSLASAARAGDPANGVDRALLASGKPASGLETFAGQFGLFDGLAGRDQAALLAALAREALDGRQDARL